MELPPQLKKAQLRLFFSVDLVGSTSFKQSSSNNSLKSDDNWRVAISSFFIDFDKAIGVSWSDSIKRLETCSPHLKSSKPTFWKGAGDEALYYVEIQSYEEVLLSVYAFIQAVKFVRIELRKTYNLDLKATSWLAGFPINNHSFCMGDKSYRKQCFPDLTDFDKFDDHFISTTADLCAYYTPNIEQNLHLDFVGPQIDLGFRLTALSSPRKMVISVDLAWLLVSTIKELKRDWPGDFNLAEHIFMEERVNLKGVLSGTRYPLIWIDVLFDDEFHALESKTLNKAPANPDTLCEYCSAFIDRMNKDHDWMIKPYVVDSNGDLEICEQPQTHKDYLAEHIERSKEALAMLGDTAEDTVPSTSQNDPLEALQNFVNAIETLRKNKGNH